ncbi:hypothetical protein HID58_063666 [Brassica napus]|uniref:Uncharacterized protein n=1 Tax=Brassica napus TaxID=3708 RepID=A0ABQ7XF12_BRANA|nr:hypothetical protein HID58_063666 [Brassica napus]
MTRWRAGILSRALSARDGVLVRYPVALALQSLYCFFRLRRVASMIGTGNSYGSSGFCSSSAESKSASVVFHFGGESGSGTQAELMVPGRSGSCLRAGQWPTQSSMAVSRSVSVLHLSFQHLLLVTILSLPIGGKRRPSFGLAVAVPLLCLATIPVPVKGLFDSSSASFVYSFGGGSSKHLLVREAVSNVVWHRDGYEFGGVNREPATPETTLELSASEATRRTSLSSDSRRWLRTVTDSKEFRRRASGMYRV